WRASARRAARSPANRRSAATRVTISASAARLWRRSAARRPRPRKPRGNPNRKGRARVNLVEGILAECNRCRELQKDLQAVGAPGAYAYYGIKASIANAERVMGQGDTVAMLRAYSDLQSWTG